MEAKYDSCWHLLVFFYAARHQFPKKIFTLFFQPDLGPCRYYPLFVTPCDDIKHLKKSSVLAAINGLGGFGDGGGGYVTAVVAAEISTVTIGMACSVGGSYCDG